MVEAEATTAGAVSCRFVARGRPRGYLLAQTAAVRLRQSATFKTGSIARVPLDPSGTSPKVMAASIARKTTETVGRYFTSDACTRCSRRPYGQKHY